MAERGWRALSTRDERVVRHLADCAGCTTRYRELVECLDAAADAVEADADAVFAPERMAHQRERILRRIDSHAQRARVLTFPASSMTMRGTAHARPVVRWVAAAALAGLMIGIGAGRMFDGRRLFNGSQSTARLTTVRPAADSPARGQATQRPAISDEQFLSELNDAVAGPRTPELEVLDALTLYGPGGSIVPVTFKY